MQQHQLTLFEELSYFEGADVEYKGAKGGLPSTLWETYSSFANTGEGMLVTSGTGRGTHHHLPSSSPHSQTIDDTNSPHLAFNSPHNGTSSPHNPETPKHPAQAYRRKQVDIT